MSDRTPTTGNLDDRLRTVKVGVRAEIEVSRHVFSGEPAYVVRDLISFQTHKLSPADYQVFVSINSQEELGRTFDRLCDSGLLDKDQKEQFYQFVPGLNQLGLLNLPVNDGTSLHNR